MTDKKKISWGDTTVRPSAHPGCGEFVQRNGEVYYKISNYHSMPPFFMTIVSASDHWMFVSSTGGITCGRRVPENAIFPYYSDDKIHDAHATTGPQTILLASKNGNTYLWKPFCRDLPVYQVERNLYKNRAGNKLIFEEINTDIGLTFSYCWSSSERFGFVRKAVLSNQGAVDIEVDLLDGLRNLLPYGVDFNVQSGMSTLVDAYKQAEAVPDCAAALYTMSSILTDRAEPSEALKATVVWAHGLETPGLLLSENQIPGFHQGVAPQPEESSNGKRGAFFAHSCFTVAASQEKCWYLLTDTEQGPSQVTELFNAIRQKLDPGLIEKDIELGTQRLVQLVGSSDGCQLSSDPLVTGRHFSNTLFNIMRGGVFLDDYCVPATDFQDFVEAWNKPLHSRLVKEAQLQQSSLTHMSVVNSAQFVEDADLHRIALEYLPLKFSRRHGDPSRPWNHFCIDVRNADGSDKLNYQGNWRDIFQNWEALAQPFPEFCESFITKFVNASTADGYNPYRIARNGFDWEVLEQESPWSNIGYWGDHQVNYLLKLLEHSHNYHPEMLSEYFSREIFVYANVPYRIKPYCDLISEPKNTVDYDQELATVIAARVEVIGSDGRLLTRQDGSIHRVNLLEKLLVPALTKIGNFVPGGGIWMNTQRPEWNDANNALVGHGLSMVTLCYLRRFLLFLSKMLSENQAETYSLSSEVAKFFQELFEILSDSRLVSEALNEPAQRRCLMDSMGRAGGSYRDSVYAGFTGVKRNIERSRLMDFLDLVVKQLDETIAENRRPDGLFHSYNLVHFEDSGFRLERLQEMLEGQVAVLSSGYLGAKESLHLLAALRASRMYCAERNSYLLYPFERLPRFLDKNVIPERLIERFQWLECELDSGHKDFVDRDVNGVAHFDGRFRNSRELRACLESTSGIESEDADALCEIYESVFRHRQFTGRSGAMYKYEGLGCIYWHMVSKLLLVSGEISSSAIGAGVDPEICSGLSERYDEIKAGLGLHQSPAVYGAFPTDAYSHTPGFGGVQQPGMTGQVKEDIINRNNELGVFIAQGQVSFQPRLLQQSEFTSKPESWQFSSGKDISTVQVESGSLAFGLCGVPVIYRLAQSKEIRIFTVDGTQHQISGDCLGTDWSQSVFRRERKILKIEVDVIENELR